MRTLNRPSLGSQATCAELQECPDTSLIWTSSAEPLNATPSVGLSSVHMVEGKHDSVTGEAAIGRIPITSQDGTPLMPCKPAKARKLLRDGKAAKKWSKLGVFYVQLKFNPKQPTTQPLTIGVDPGSKFEGTSVVGTEDTVLNIMSEAVDWVKDALTQRREMRRARRYRKTRRRPERFNNRHAHGKIPPSTKARWDAKLRIITQLKKIIPIRQVIVEDIKAETRPGQKRWNASFSPLEVGKQYFYAQLRSMGLKVETLPGTVTRDLRDKFCLKKISDKSRLVFESHCVDAWVLAASTNGATHPTTKSLYYVVPLRWHRRQLHRLEPDREGLRRRYGGTVSLGIKKGTLVKHTKHGMCYVGGNLRGRFSLHDSKTGERVTQNAKREEFRRLTASPFRTQFLPRINRRCPCGDFYEWLRVPEQDALTAHTSSIDKPWRTPEGAIIITE